MKVAILLLCHEPASILAKRLSAPFFQNPDIKIYIHYDGHRKERHVNQLRALMPSGVKHEILHDRVQCAWGEYSLVEATHRLMRSALSDQTFQGNYFSLMSGSCLPTRPATSLLRFLESRDGTDFIESVDISKRKWVLDGIQEERYKYYFPFNFKTQKNAFERLTEIQRKLRISRQIPQGLNIHFGSQWFTITRQSAEQICIQLEDPNIRKFFKNSWIPDEFAVQTLIRIFQSPEKIANHSLTYYEFDPSGRPFVLDNGHFDHLLKQPFFFARKVSPTAATLLQEVEKYQQFDEQDFGYFSNVGNPTPHYRCFAARATSVISARAKVATIADPWRGIMDASERAYYVIWSSSRDYIQSIISILRKQHPGPVYGYLFDSFEMDMGGNQPDRFGLSPSMLARRNIAPDSVLYEATNAHPVAPCIFAIDPTDATWARDFIYWDPNATLICCDPADLTRMQRAEAFLRRPRRHWHPNLVTETYQGAFGNKWLPIEHFLKMSSENPPRSKLINLFGSSEPLQTEALEGIRVASAHIDTLTYFLSDHLAWVNLKRAQPGGSH